MAHPTESLLLPDLPSGPPLHLERPGRAVELLAPFVQPVRLERLRCVLAQRTRRFTFLLERVRDPHNIAACARTADAFGVQDLHTIPADADSALRLSTEVSRGAHRWLTLHTHATLEAALHHLRGQGYRVAATDLSGEAPPVPIHRVELAQPLCVAFGNEGEGISPALRRAADLSVTVPMVGFSESLNISVAFAVVAHCLRTRHDEAPAADPLLGADERARLLDRWMVRDVPRAFEVLRDVARRRGDSGPGG